MRKTKGEGGQMKRSPYIIGLTGSTIRVSKYRLLARRRDDFWVAGIHQRNGKDCFELLTVPPPIMVVNWQENDVDCSLNTNTSHGMRRNQKEV